MGDDFDDWLRKKLADISPGCDIDVFVAYLRGILETEPSQEEQLQSVCDTLEELGVTYVYFSFCFFAQLQLCKFYFFK